MLWKIVVLVIIIWLVKRRWLLRRQIALAKQIKSNLKTWPVIGHAYKCMGTEEEKMTTIIRDIGRDAFELGGMSSFYLYDQPIICVADPAIAQIVLNKCLDKHSINKLMGFLIGRSSIITSETIMGITSTSLNVESDNFKTAITELWNFLNYLAYRPWLWPNFLRYFLPSYGKMNEHRHTAWDFVTEIIKDKRKQTEGKTMASKETASAVKGISFLDFQLEAPEHQKFSDKELIQESITLYVAGSDTTSVGISYIILMLCRHLDVQDKLNQELQDVFGDSDRPVKLEDLSRLQYLEAVIKETLRLYPPVPAIGRQAVKDVELPSGITLVEGCGIMINIWAVHRNPKYWGDDADQFRPERFLNSTSKHPAAFMAFSYGSRDCIGIRLAMMSMKTVLATLFRRYRALPPPGVQQGEPLRTKFSMMMRHADNYLIRLEPRK